MPSFWFLDVPGVSASIASNFAQNAVLLQDQKGLHANLDPQIEIRSTSSSVISLPVRS
jgi:hypothetical protein